MGASAGQNVAGEPRGGEGSSSAQHIARVAARLFAERGYDATSVREIVEAAGVTKPTLYYHFGSKEGLAQALVSRPMEQLCEAMRSRRQAAAGPEEALAAMLQAKLDFCVEEPDRARFFYALFFGPLATGLANEIARCGCSMDDLLLEGVRDLVDAGIVEAGRVEGFVAALNGVVVVSTIDFLYRGRPLGPDAARRLVDDLLRGFGTSRT